MKHEKSKQRTNHANRIQRTNSIDNKNGIIIATDVTQDANDQNQLVPMINLRQNKLQHALNITPEESEELMHNMDILADNGYYKDK